MIFDLSGSEHVRLWVLGVIYLARLAVGRCSWPCLGHRPPCPPAAPLPPHCRCPQIGETLGRYGINPECKHVLAARFDATPEEEQQLRSLVEGAPVPLEGAAGDGVVLKARRRLWDWHRKPCLAAGIDAMRPALLQAQPAFDLNPSFPPTHNAKQSWLSWRMWRCSKST